MSEGIPFLRDSAVIVTRRCKPRAGVVVENLRITEKTPAPIPPARDHEVRIRGDGSLRAGPRARVR